MSTSGPCGDARTAAGSVTEGMVGPAGAASIGAPGLQRLLQAVMAVSGDLSLEGTLRRIVEAAVDLVDARYGALGVSDETGSRLSSFITVGVDPAGRQAIGTLTQGRGLLGLLLQERRPLRLPDLSRHAASFGFPPHHPPMRSFLGVPVDVRGQLFGSLYLTDKRGGEFSDVDEQLAVTLAAAAGAAIERARLFERAQRYGAAMSAMHEVATAFVAGTDSAENLLVVARSARLLLDADLATIAVPDGGWMMRIDVADGSHAERLLGERFPMEGSISGEVLASGRTTVVADVASTRQVTQPQTRLETLGPTVFEALSVDGRPVASLAVSRARGDRGYSAEDLEVVATLAASAGVVLGHEQARRQRARLSLLEVRDDIARNLHDTVIQRLFAVALSLQGASGYAPEGTAVERVPQAVRELDRVIQTIRTVIFDLQTVGSTERPGLRRQVLDLGHELAGVLGVEPAVTFSGPLDQVPDPVAGELVSTLREALSNVARHAHATQVAVDVAADGHEVTLNVHDDGVGLPPDASGRGLGVGNMRARAERLGGQFRLHPASGGGTALHWRVPEAGRSGPVPP